MLYISPFHVAVAIESCFTVTYKATRIQNHHVALAGALRLTWFITLHASNVITSVYHYRSSKSSTGN